MKRLLLLSIFIAIFSTSFSQLSWGTKIGQTYFDLHSNKSTGNRLVRTADGSMSATWISHWDFLTVDNLSKPGVMGFGYNHFDVSSGAWVYGQDGECWEEAFGCATQNTGWPEIINLESANGNGNKELVISHTPLMMTERQDVGVGNWDATTDLSIETDFGMGDWDGFFPRSVASGQYIHLVTKSNAQGGFFDFPSLIYFRSDDGGATWSSPYEFDVADSVINQLITPVYSYDSIGVYLTSQIDTSWMDTVLSGSFSLGSTTYNSDAYFEEDTIFLTGNQDTMIVIISDTLTNVDTIAIRLWSTYDSVSITIYDTIVGADTTYNTIQEKLVETVDADGYAIHANGASVAVTFGGGIDNDWVLFKSDDNGDNWNRTWVKDNHNLTTVGTSVSGDDIKFTNNASFDVIIDDAGTAHVFASTSITDGQFIYEDVQLYKDLGGGIMYWKEGMATEPKVVATPDYSEDGDDSNYSIPGSAYYGFFFAGWPSASFDTQGNLFLIYSAIQEGTEYINPTTGDTVGYMDLYLTFSIDNGGTWGNGMYDWCGNYIEGQSNIAEDAYGVYGGTPIEDDLYPSTVPKVESDGLLHFTWQGDYNQPGLTLYDATHPNDVLNYIQYSAIDVSGFMQRPANGDGAMSRSEGIDCTGMKEEKNQLRLNISPNPSTSFVIIEVSSIIESVSVMDVLGKEVYKLNDIKSKTLRIKTSDLIEGIYLVKVESEIGIATQKLVISR